MQYAHAMLYVDESYVLDDVLVVCVPFAFGVLGRKLKSI